jgi:ABC-2 type transport system permease protein
MLGSLQAEVFKLLRRPAVWVCLAILLVLVVALGYLLVWFVYSHPNPQTAAQLPRGVTFDQLKHELYPQHFVQITLSTGTQLGVFIAMILGVLIQGSEYGWGTLKTLFTQKPTRIEVLAAKLLATALLMLVTAVVVLGAGAAASALLAAIDGRSSAFPDTTTIAKAALALWLILTFWAWFGLALATLFRQSALAIGLGLAYALVIESLIFGLAAQFGGDPVRQVQQWFPLANTQYLLESFGRATTLGTATKPFADATHGVVMLLLYCALCIAVSSALFQRRDVTS